MAITLTGTAGNNFNISVTDTATNTGSKSVTYTDEVAVRSVTYTNSSKVCSYSGQIGTTGTTIDLYALADANDGTYFMRLQDTQATIVLSSLLVLNIHNKDVTNSLTVVPGASNSFLPASEQITVKAGCSVQLVFPAGQTVNATTRNIKLVGAAVALSAEIYILGN